MARIREGGGLGGGWFRANVSKRVRDGSDTLFWTDPWVEGIPLCERFGRLFDLAETKLRTVAEMFSRGWGVDWEACEWRRQWQRQPDPDEGYTAIGAYQLLTSQVSATMDDVEKLMWNSHIPLKVSIFTWRLLLDRYDSSLVRLLQYLWFSLGISAFVDLHHIGGLHFYT
ncbi:hypothetical protein TSUD_12930 [Trifolium subterraneum]|uniref:Reverse transcriptase zinc-binding domain-containing protein n=1 Tax=Trifolium subterraneum TaxID=3900 RepID=A0A2Z6P4T5_TRISU|nr:hypothetical protein TSUD_12930 [Trifolium subterraneum]